MLQIHICRVRPCQGPTEWPCGKASMKQQVRHMAASSHFYLKATLGSVELTDVKPSFVQWASTQRHSWVKARKQPAVALWGWMGEVCYCEWKRESAAIPRKDRPTPFSIWKFGNYDSFQTYPWNAQSLTKVYLIRRLALNAQYLDFLPPMGDSLLLTEHLASFIHGKYRA